MKPSPLLFFLALLTFAAPTLADSRGDTPGTPPSTPQDQLARFHVPPGFEVQLVGAEPDIQKPINLNFDAAGRLWVTGSEMYPWPASTDPNGKPIDGFAEGWRGIVEGFRVGDAPQPADTARDTVRILGDFDATGRARKITVFADKLNIPSGIEPLPHGSAAITAVYGLPSPFDPHPEMAKRGPIAERHIGKFPKGDTAIVYSIPNIWMMSDWDGDGFAESRLPLYTGFGYTDTHGGASSFIYWIDGWIYGTHGFRNHSEVRDRNGKVTVLDSGNTYRFRPDGTAFEIYTHGQTNPFGLAFDPLGNLFSADSHSKPVYMLLRGGYYEGIGKQHDGLGFAPRITDDDHGSSAIAGIAFYADDRWPAEYRGNLFNGNPVTQRINRDRLEWHGSTPQAIRMPDFLTCDDPWFRPVNLKLGPDGALYIADFYNPIIGHYEVPLTHPARDHAHGRIWRVVWRGNGTGSLPKEVGQGWVREGVPQARGTTVSSVSVPFPDTDKVLSATDKVLSKPEKVISTPDKVMSATDKVMSASDKVISATEKVLSKPEKVMPASDKVISAPEKVMSATEKVISTPDIVFSRASKVISAAEIGASESPKTASPPERTASLPNRVASRAEKIASEVEKVPAAPDGTPSTPGGVPSRADEIPSKAPIPVRAADIAAASGGALDPSAAAGDSPGAQDTAAPREKKVAPSSTLNGVPGGSPATALGSSAPPGVPIAPPPDLTVLDAPALIEKLTDPSLEVRRLATNELVDRVGNGSAARPKEIGGDEVTRSAEQWQALIDQLPAARERRTIVEALAGHPDSAFIPLVLRLWTEAPPDDAALIYAARVALRNSLRTEGAYALAAPLTSGDSRAGEMIADVSVAVPNAEAATFLLAHLERTKFETPRAGEYLKHVMLYLPAERLAAAAQLFAGMRQNQPLPARLALATSLAEAARARGEAVPAAMLEWSRDVVLETLVSNNDELTKPAIAAVRDWKLEAKLEPLTKIARDETRDGALRQAALEAAANLPASRALLIECFHDPRPMMVRKRAAELLAQNGDPATVLAALPQAPWELALAIAGALAKSDRGAAALLEAIEAGQAPPRVLTNKAVAGSLFTRPKALQERARALAKEVPPEDARLDAVIAERAVSFRKAPRRVDTLKHGAEVFAQQCAGCHRFRNTGGNVGPNLDGAGARGAQRLIEDILDPSRNVDPGFRQTIVETADGRTMVGTNPRESAEALALTDAAGTELLIPKPMIKTRTTLNVSMMPPIFETQLTAGDLNDLVGYLLAPGRQ